MSTCKLFVFALGASLLAVPSAARADRVIDAFSDPLPLTTLPGTTTAAPLMWAGRTGGQARPAQVATQTQLDGALGATRSTLVQETSMTNLVVASSTTVGSRPALSYATGTGPSGLLAFEYGALADLNVDLASDGSRAFELTIDGDLNDGAAPRPVQLTVKARTGATLRTKTYSLLADGVYQFPFADFPGVDFTDVDYLAFSFDASAVNAVDYTLLGGLRTTNCLQTAGAVVADFAIDSFTNELPPSSLPGAGSYPIVWAGTFNGSTQAVGQATQTGLSATVGGQRLTRVAASAIQNFLTASMSSVDATGALSYATSYPTSGTLTLWYGASGALNANLSALRAFELELQGDLATGAPRPVQLTITVTSGATSASAQATLLANGRYYVPFTSFAGINFADVDALRFTFDASAVQAVDFTLVGGLRASRCTR